MQFNLFGEDPVTTVTQSPLPWKPFFEQNYESEGVIPLDIDKRNMGTIPTGGGGGGGEDVYNDAMLTWKNEDWAVQLTEKEKKGENRNPFAGKNPCAVTKLGKKGITGKHVNLQSGYGGFLTCQEWRTRLTGGGCLLSRTMGWSVSLILRRIRE